ncbi:MAG: SDR family NAD(P)-dependent oxidoreductase [Acidimicrobiia bacterium]
MTSLAGRVGLVTGAAGGIGRGVVEAATAAGATVAALDLDPPPGSALSSQCDVTDEAQVARAVEETAARLGPVSFLVCAAGVVSEAPVTELTVAEWRRVVDSSLLGTFLTARAVVPSMREGGGGAIVACSSGYATKGYRHGAHYAAAKAGVEALVKSLALEIGENGITANAVAPGPVDTGMLDHIEDRSAWQSRMEAAIPLGRVGQAADVVGAVLFLCGDEARYITGQVLHVNGGLLMP